MEIKIGEKTYNLAVNGTVGIAFMVEQMTDETFDSTNKKHLIYLIYVVLKTSNPDEDISIDWLLCNLTATTMNDAITYITKRWKELEGKSHASEEKPKGKKKV